MGSTKTTPTTQILDMGQDKPELKYQEIRKSQKMKPPPQIQNYGDLYPSYKVNEKWLPTARDQTT